MGKVIIRLEEQIVIAIAHQLDFIMGLIGFCFESKYELSN